MMHEPMAAGGISDGAERKRLSIAMQQLYAALLTDFEARGGMVDASFSQALNEAVRLGLVTPSAAAQIRGLAYTWVRIAAEPADDEGEADSDAGVDWDVPWFPEPGEHPSADKLDSEVDPRSLVEAAEQIGLLAKRVLGQIPIGRVPDLTRPPVLDAWTPLPQTLEALSASGGFAAVRDSSGYCVLLTFQDVGAWLAQTGPLPEPFSVSASDLLGFGREQWSAVDASVPVEEVESLVSDWSARIAAVLVFSNEDYSGDPVGLVTAQTFQEWQRASEKRRRSLGWTFEAEVNGPDFEAEGAYDAADGVDALARALGCDLLFVADDDGLARALLVALAGSTRGATARELCDVMMGVRSSSVAGRGLAVLPVFGCAHAMDALRVERACARLVSLGAARTLPSGSLVLGPDALSALVSDDPAGAVEALLASAPEQAERGGEA